jgi:hypothetical protein
MKSVMLCAAAALLLGSPAVAQVTPYRTADQAKKTDPNDPNKLVCERQLDIGSRLGARKLCLTVQQWRDKHNEQRGFTEDIQAGSRARDSVVQTSNFGPQ